VSFLPTSLLFSSTLFIFYIFLHLMILPMQKLWAILMVNNSVFLHYTTRITIMKFLIINFSHTFIVSELPTIIDSYIKIHNTPEFFFFPFIWLLAKLNPRGIKDPLYFFLADFSYHIHSLSIFYTYHKCPSTPNFIIPPPPAIPSSHGRPH
jgi:hypothetical protein